MNVGVKGKVGGPESSGKIEGKITCLPDITSDHGERGFCTVTNLLQSPCFHNYIKGLLPPTSHII